MINIFKSKEAKIYEKKILDFTNKLEEYGYVFDSDYECGWTGMSSDNSERCIKELYTLYDKHNFDVTTLTPKAFLYNINCIRKIHKILDIDDTFDINKIFQLYTTAKNNKFTTFSETFENLLYKIIYLMENNLNYSYYFTNSFTRAQIDFIYYAIKNNISPDPYINMVEIVRTDNKMYQNNFNEIIKAIELGFKIEILEGNCNLKETFNILTSKNYNSHFSEGDSLQFKEYSSEQLTEIWNGLKSNINVKCYFKSDISHEMMKKVRNRLEEQSVTDIVNNCNGIKTT